MYPFTIINKDQLPDVDLTLRSLGYNRTFCYDELLTVVSPSEPLYVVINDGDRFGEYHCYREGMMSSTIPRINIRNLFSFLQQAALAMEDNEL